MTEIRCKRKYWEGRSWLQIQLRLPVTCTTAHLYSRPKAYISRIYLALNRSTLNCLVLLWSMTVAWELFSFPFLTELGQTSTRESKIFWLCLPIRNILVKIIFTSQTYLSTEGVVHEPEKISEEISVGVLAELVQDKPVPQIAVAQHVLTAGQVGGREAPDLEDDEEPS